MSMAIRHQLQIDAPARVVWSVIEDLDAYPEWNPFVVACRSTLQVGDPIDMRVRLFPGFSQPQSEQVFEHVPGRLLRYGLPASRSGALSSSRSHDLRPLGPDRCEYISDFRLEGWLSPLVSVLLGARLRAGFTNMSEAIARRAEELGRRDRS